MYRALGFSDDLFDPANPGPLCRGRERWIDPIPDLEPTPPLHRLVISGAQFADDSAQDAERGLVASGVPLAEIIAALFPGGQFLAFTEDGHPADIPDGAEGIEAFNGFRAGGRHQEMRVRWQVKIAGREGMRDLLGEDPSERLLGMVLWDEDSEKPDFLDHLYLLTGLSTVDSPPARFQPVALPDLLEFVPAVLLFHRDKHSIALGVYYRDELPLVRRLHLLAEKLGALLVFFDIPPMLARWDRALHEARADWESRRTDPFPVPRAARPSGRSRRSRAHELDYALIEEEDFAPSVEE